MRTIVDMLYHGSLSNALQLESSSHRPSNIISQKSSRAPSIESLQHSQTSQTLRKVRSTYALSHSPTSPPDPTATSQPLPHNSARASGFFADPGRKFKTKSRPSTATGSPEELPSWDRHSATAERTRSTAPSIRSRASSTAISSLSTGRVEDVTPWELHPGPMNHPGSTPLFTMPRSTLVQSTGPIEDVTPWELHPLPSDSTPERSHSVSSSPPPSAVRSARSPSNATSVSVRSIRSTATGPTEDVTPWELHPGPIYEEDLPAPDWPSPMPSISQHSFHTPSVRSHRSSTATGPTEEVTPWELHPGPDETIPEDDRPLSPRLARPLSNPPSVRAPSVRSHRQSTATGPTEEVAPWELYPDPPSDATYSAPTHPRLPRSTAPSLRSHRSAGAGFTEEATLWEIHPGGTIHEEPLSMNSRKASFAGSATTPSVKSHRSTATGPMEVVTPWDLHPPGTIPEEEVHLPPTSASTRSLPIKSTAPSLIFHRSTATGPTEEVTPWELHPAGTIPEEPTQGVTPLELHPVVSSEALKKTISTRSLTALSVTSHRSTATGPIEDVTPWELHQPGTIPEETFDTSAPTSSSPLDEKSNVSGPEEGVTPSPGYSESPGQTIEEFPLPSQTIPPQPARSMTLPSRSTTTGPKEEVTPWELHPDPTSEQGLEPPPNLDLIGRSRNSLQMTVAQLQEVTPWELHPVPSTQGGQKALEPAARASTSTANKSPSDPDLVRRRSTNSKPHKARTHPHPTNESHQKDASSIKSFKASTSSSSHAMPLPKTQATVPQMPSKSSSTEGKSNERPVHFVVKGARHALSDGGISPGQKHHAYPREVVPYPRSYEQEVIDLDVWETVFCQDICESLTWHVFETPPEKVLEIGCGTGTWILNCARSWKDTKFVGLDIVPLFPNMPHIYLPDLEKRITWVQGNLLEGLPFPDGEFDFVHIKRIALGVPEDKWDALFDEISRVMKPGAAFEMIEEDLFFPGRPADSDGESDRESEIDSPSSRRNSVGAAITNGKGTEEVCETSGSPATPTTGTPQSPLRSGSLAQSHSTSFSSSVKKDNAVASTTPPNSPPTVMTMVPPHSRSSNRPLLYVKTAKPNHSPYGHLQLVGLGAPRHQSSLFGGSAISLMGSMGHASSETDSHLFKRPRSSSILNSSTSTNPTMNDSNSPQNLRSPPVAESVNGTGPSKVAPFLLRTLSKAPMNPRDHSLLEIIYNEMLASRFINISPLSLLTTYLEYHFKDTRTHPPLQYTFPPMPVKPSDTSSVQRDANSDDSDLEEEGSSNRFQSYRTRNSPGPDPHSIHKLSSQSILHHTSPYVILDEARSPAYSPSTKAVFPTKKNNDCKLEYNRRTQSRLPNQTLHIDLRTLNLHLAIRAKEILACSESMWEWVLEYQAKVQAQEKLGRPRPISFEASHPGMSQTSIVSGNSSTSTESTKSALLEITRDDFDYILSNFELDMQDQISLGHALKERFSWSVLSSSPSINRKAFDAACEKYDQWVAQQRQQTSSHSFRHVHDHHSSNLLSNSDKVSDTPNTISSREGMARNQSISSHTGEGESLKPTPLPHDATVHFASHSPTASGQSTVPSPTQRLSRSVRVFVAWKA